MSRLRSKFVWTGIFVLCAVLPISTHSLDPREFPPAGPPTCDASQIDADSYALTTRAMARIVTKERLSWWDGFNIGKANAALQDVNFSSIRAAERAMDLDTRNLLAYGVLAREYVIVGEDASRAEAAWRTVLDNGGALVWTATLYDVDVKSYFLLAFDREALRVYRLGAVVGAFQTHLGMPVFSVDSEPLWRAWAGCLDRGAHPEAVIPWRDVREIKAGNWVLYFKLAHKVTIRSDRDKNADLDEIKVNLHGATGSLELVADPKDPWKIDARRSVGPLAYQERVRRTLVRFVDPDGRIVLPKASRSAGW